MKTLINILITLMASFGLAQDKVINVNIILNKGWEKSRVENEIVKQDAEIILIDNPFFYIENLKLNNDYFIDTFDLMSSNFYYFLDSFLLKSDENIFGLGASINDFEPYLNARLDSITFTKVRSQLLEFSGCSSISEMLTYPRKLTDKMVDDIFLNLVSLSDFEKSVIRFYLKTKDEFYWTKQLRINNLNYSIYTESLILFNNYTSKINYNFIGIPNRKDLRKIRKRYSVKIKKMKKYKEIVLKNGDFIYFIDR